MMSGRRSAIPVAISPVRPSLPLLRHAARYYNCSGAIEHAGKGRRYASHCTAYGTPSATPSSPPEDTPANHYASTLEAAPVQAQDTPRRRDWSKIRQDGRQILHTVRHAATRSKIVRHACKSPSPWSIKGRRSPRRRDIGQRIAVNLTLSASPRYWHSPQSHLLGLGGHASSPASLVATPLQAPRCKEIQCLEHTPAGRTAPAGTRINQVSLVA
jgi:hypothetical protein